MAAGLATLVLFACLLAGCGGTRETLTTAGNGTYTVGLSPSSSTLTTGTAAGATGTQATSSSTTGRDGRPPALAHLQAVLVHEARQLGPGVSVLVEDLSTHQTLFDEAADVGRPPASLEKLYTSAAVLWLLGAQAQLHTELLGTGSLGPGGVWHGNLYLRGDGDPTFGDGGWNHLYENGEGLTVSQLIAALRARGIRRVDGLLYADPSRFDTVPGGPATGGGPDPGDYGGEMSALVYDHGMTAGALSPAASAVHEVALAARGAHLRLIAARQTVVTPADATPLVTLSSPPMSSMLSLMLVPSDDLFADLFTKQLGYHLYGRGTLALGSLAIRQSISTHYAISPTIFDGSGLDRSDRSSADELLALLRGMYGTPVGQVVRADMAVVGHNGTVAGIGVHTPAAGRCQAKTGTLNAVTNLAGYCWTAGGDTLAFVFLVDGPSNWQALSAFTPMVGAVAGY